MSQGNWGGQQGSGHPGAPPRGYGPPPGVYAPPGPGAYGPGGRVPLQMRYEDVPWFRKNGINSAFVLLGICFPPLLWTVCVIVLTGPVYMDAYDEHGQLKQWGVANKVVAVILIGLQIVGIILRFAR